MQIVTRLLGMMVMTLGLGACSGCSNMSVEKGDEAPFEQPLPVNTESKKLAIGYAASIGVKEDGTVWSWGTNLKGVLGDGKDDGQRFVPAPIPGMTEFLEVVGGGDHFVALRKDGTVWSWGDNKYGQLGYETPPDIFKRYFNRTPRQIPSLSNIVGIAAATGHSLALDREGNVFAFGANEGQQLGIYPKDDERHITPKLVYQSRKAVKVVAGVSASAIITDDKRVVYWGANSYEMLPVAARDGEKKSVLMPTEIYFKEKISDVVISTNAIYFLDENGFVWSKGSNINGYLGQGDREPREDFVQVKNIGRVISLVSDGLSASVLDGEGRIWQWGGYVRWRPNAGASPVNAEPYPIKKPEINQPVRLYGGSGNAAFAADGAVYYWGWSRLGNRGTGKPSGEYQTPENWMGPELSLWKWK